MYDYGFRLKRSFSGAFLMWEIFIGVLLWFIGLLTTLAQGLCQRSRIFGIIRPNVKILSIAKLTSFTGEHIECFIDVFFFFFEIDLMYV